MKLKKDLDPTKIQQMSKKPNRNPTNETKTQQKSNNSSEKPNKNPTKKPNIDGRCWVLGSSKNPTKNPTFCWICWILVGFFLLGCRPQLAAIFSKDKALVDALRGSKKSNPQMQKKEEIGKKASQTLVN